MENYKHGIEIIEKDTKSNKAKRNLSAVSVIIGTAPINRAVDIAAAVNKVVICNDFEEAKNKLGYSGNFKDYTLCQAMYAAFEVFETKPVIFVNVLDPKKHKDSVTEKEVAVSNKQAIVNDEGVLIDTLKIKHETTLLTKNVDYIAGFDKDGNVYINLLASGRANLATALKCDYDKLKPSGVTELDVIGGYNKATGENTGIELIREVFPKFGLVPGFILAPVFSSKKEVAASLQGKCRELNGIFSTMCLIDLPCGTLAEFTEIAEEKGKIGVSSECAISLWPMLKVKGKVLSYSVIYAALCNHIDSNNGDVPHLYPSNKVLNVDSICLADGKEFFIDGVDANILNANGIVTAINQNGIKSWGNNTSAYPETADPKNRWIAVRRMFNWYGNNFILRFAEKVDNPANHKLIESFIDSENIYANSLVAEQKVAGIELSYDPSENSTKDILEGKGIKFKEKIAPYTPAEYIKNELSFDPDMIIKAFGGDNN